MLNSACHLSVVDGAFLQPNRLEELAKQLKSGKKEVKPIDAKDLTSAVTQRSAALAASLKQADARDKARNRERIRERHKEERAKFKQENRQHIGGYTLGGQSDDDDDDAAAADVIEDSDDSDVSDDEPVKPVVTAPSKGSKKREQSDAHAKPVTSAAAPVDLESAALSLLMKKRRV